MSGLLMRDTTLLLFVADCDPTNLTDAEVWAIAEDQFRRLDGDMTRCCAEAADELADHWDVAPRRYDCCVIRAARLLEVQP